MQAPGWQPYRVVGCGGDKEEAGSTPLGASPPAATTPGATGTPAATATSIVPAKTRGGKVRWFAPLLIPLLPYTPVPQS